MTQSFSDRVLGWYDHYGRKDLPWHHQRTPYRVWISEIMLQQTQVATVIPYYNAFMASFPTVEALATAPIDDVLGHWSGLGYYARARNLHKAARRVMDDHGGQFPGDPEALQDLPGIGRSTAAAILAQAFNIRAAILDGNVKRVLARHHAVEGWPGRTATVNRLWEHAEAHTPGERIRDYTQAIMDLGAMVCTRRKPDCTGCPVSVTCEAHRLGNPESYPAPKPRKAKPEKTVWMAILEDDKGRILLERRPPSGIWGGLWSLPELPPEHDPEDLAGACHQRFGVTCNLSSTLTAFRHTFSHYHLHILPALLTAATGSHIMDNGDQRWVYRDEALGLGLPAPVRTLITAPEQPLLL